MEHIVFEDLPVAVAAEGVDFRSREVGDMSIAWVKLGAGADLRPALAGLPGDMCPCPHWGYMLRGELRMHTSRGEKTYSAGQAFYWAAGHAPEAVTDCEYIDFSPTPELRTVLRHVTGS
ncbi:hypothetical protein [Mycolicibacterium celeriflavum]|uniref:hypothetical protein n=1 Tax=Mycolicibacterium celeriflavum TaxID=1249101 RepID=UPI003CEBF839